MRVELSGESKVHWKETNGVGNNEKTNHYRSNESYINLREYVIMEENEVPIQFSFPYPSKSLFKSEPHTYKKFKSYMCLVPHMGSKHGEILQL